MTEFQVGDRVIVAGEVRKLVRRIIDDKCGNRWEIDAPISLITEWDERHIQPHPRTLDDVCERLDDIKRLLEWLTNELTGRN